MPDFVVDVHELARAARAASVAVPAGVSDVATAAPGEDATGDADLAAAVGAFAANWKTGIDVLRQDVTNMANALADTALSYAEADADAAARFERLGGHR